MRPCEACGDWQPVGWKIERSGPTWIASGVCPRCRAERRYLFQGPPDLLSVRPPYAELGGRAPSQLVDPYALMCEHDRVVPSILRDGARLVEPEWSRNYDRLERVLVALAELAKFIPDGEVAVPASAFRDGAGRADQAARPERYARDWLVAERARWKAIGSELARSAPRPAAPAATRGTLDRAALDAHRAWLHRGRTGDGRLDVLGFDARGGKLEGIELTGARLERVVLARCALGYIQLGDAELIDCDLTQAIANYARLTGAMLRGCTLDGGQLGLAVCDRAWFADCSLERVWMDRSSWRDAVIEGCRMRHVQFGDSRLDGAKLVACDLREAEFIAKDQRIEATSRGALLERCDLRGADFTGRDLAGASLVACKLAGAHGAPARTDGWTVIDADFSEAGDGSDLGDAGDLLDQLRG